MALVEDGEVLGSRQLDMGNVGLTTFWSGITIPCIKDCGLFGRPHFHVENVGLSLFLKDKTKR